MKNFLDEIKFQLKQDHDYYHSSLLNQSFHFISGCLNVSAVALFFVKSFELGFALFLFSWGLRQTGHFFFESKEFDVKLNKSFEQKESEKVGANLERKRIMIAGLALAVILFFLAPNLLVKAANFFGFSTTSAFSAMMFFGLCVFLVTWVWRTLWLIVFHSPLRGVSWFFKIMYDPINDIILYAQSPVKLIRSRKGRPA